MHCLYITPHRITRQQQDRLRKIRAEIEGVRRFRGAGRPALNTDRLTSTFWINGHHHTMSIMTGEVSSDTRRVSALRSAGGNPGTRRSGIWELRLPRVQQLRGRGDA